MARRAPGLPAWLVPLAGLLLAACEGDAGFAGLAPDGGPPPDAGGDTIGPTTYVGQLPTVGNSYRLLRGRGAQKGTPLTPADFFAALAPADGVCLGEIHDDPIHHAAQLLVLDGLATQAAQATRALALGLEMVQWPFQAALDSYAAGAITEAAMLQMVQWQARWGFDYGLYRPLVARALQAGSPLRGLNAPRELTRKVAQQGLAALTPQEQAQLPELDLTSASHRAWFAQAVGQDHLPPGSFDNVYAVQVIWDETMADRSWRWLSEQAGPRQIAIIAGNGHCIDLAIPARLRRRGAAQVLSVKPVEESAAVIAKELADELSDYLVVIAP